MTYLEAGVIFVHCIIVIWIGYEFCRIKNDGGWAWVFPGVPLLFILTAAIVSFCWRGDYLNGKVPPPLIALKKTINR